MVKTTPGTEHIEEDIRATRRDIDDKIERIQQRLSPGDIVDSVIDFAKSNGGAVAGGIGRTVRENPVPVAMVGAGILWLALSSRAKRQADDGGRLGDGVRAKVEEGSHKLRDRAAALGSDVRDRAGKVSRKARSQATRASQSTGRFVKDHPVLVGVAGVAVGAAVAASLPRSDREDRAFGERSDRMKEAAKSAAVREGRKVQDAAKAAVKKAKETAEAKAPTAEDVKRDATQTANAGGIGTPR